jgi:hypothetical protein
MKENGKLTVGGQTWTLDEAYAEVDRRLQLGHEVPPERPGDPERCIHSLVCFLVEPIEAGKREPPTDARRLEILTRARKFWKNAGHRVRDPATPFDERLAEAEARRAGLTKTLEQARRAAQSAPQGTRERANLEHRTELALDDLREADREYKLLSKQRTQWRMSAGA